MVKLYIMSNDRPTLDGIIEVEPSYMDNDRVDYWPEGLLKGNEQGYGDMGGHTSTRQTIMSGLLIKKLQKKSSRTLINMT